MGPLLQLSRWIDSLNARIGRISAWFLLAMIGIGAFNALARYSSRWLGADLSSNTLIEAQWYLFSAAFLLASAHTLSQNDHVRVDVLYGRLDARKQAWIDLAGGILFLLPFCIFGVWISLEYVADSWAVWEGSPDPGGLPRYPLKTIIPVTFSLLLAQGLSECIKRVAFLRGLLPTASGQEEAS